MQAPEPPKEADLKAASEKPAQVEAYAARGAKSQRYQA